MSPKPLSWQSALSASVVIHALLVGGIGLIFFQSAPVGGSGMLTVDLGGPAGMPAVWEICIKTADLATAGQAGTAQNPIQGQAPGTD